MLVDMRSTSTASTAVVLVTAAVMLLLAIQAPATAHTGGDADVVLTLDEPPAALDGMTVEVVNRLAPQLVLANPTDSVVEVLGIEGRPFLRIGPDGVEANLAVADWYTTNDPFAGGDLPDVVGGEDVWGLVAQDPAWGWFDHRLHPGPLQAPQEIVAIGEPADFERWAVDLVVDGRPATLQGAFRYQPLRGGFVPSITVPPPSGVQLAVLPGLVPGLFLDNATGDEVLVRGEDGEPFLRVGADAVHANVRSPAWIASARASEGTTPTDVVDATAEPEWVQVADVPRYGWIDPRLSYPDREPSRAVIATAEPADVAEWTVPIEVAGDAISVEGVITWQPNPDLEPAATDDPLGWTRWLAVLVVAGLAVGGLAFTRRGARRSPAADR